MDYNKLLITPIVNHQEINTMVQYRIQYLRELQGDINKSSYIEADIMNIYTIPSMRHKGVSSKVLEYLISKAKNMGVSKLSLHTSKAGEALYRKYGFHDPYYPVLELELNQNQ